MITEESRMLEMIGWYQEQYRILHDRCDSLTSRVRAAEAEVKALRQKLEECSLHHGGGVTQMMEELE